MEKSRNEDRNKILVGLCFVAFFMIAAKCTGQIELKRSSHYEASLKHDVTTIFPVQGLKFGSPTKIQTDTIHLNVMADSIGVDSYYIRLYAFFPKGLDVRGKSIFLRFDDGNYFKCKQIRYEGDDNYCEYSVDKNIYSDLNHRKFIAVIFEDLASSIEIKNKDFFKDFFTSF